MKRTLTIFLTLAMLLALLPAQALAANRSGELDGFKYTISGSECRITGYTADLSADAVIPDEIDGASVTIIDDNAFAYCQTLKSLKLPSHLRSISNFAFEQCSLNCILDLPASMQSISEYAFINSKIIGIRIPGPLSTTALRFANLPIVIMPAEYFPTESLSCVFLDYNMIGDSFQNARIISRDGLEFLVGSDCAGLLQCTAPEHVTIPATYEGVPVTMLLDHAFGNASRMTSLTLPDSIEIVGRGALATIDISSFTGKNVRYIGDNAFLNCSGLKSVDLPNIESIGVSAFMGCSSLRTLNLGSNLKELHDGAFSGCTALRSVSLPSGLTLLGSAVFANDPITSLYIPASVRTLASSTVFDLPQLNALTLHDGMESIAAGAISGCPNLKTLTIPATVTEIGEQFLESSLQILGEPGSTAQTYAEAHSISFDSIHNHVPFADITEDTWYFPAVKYCYWSGLMNGTSESTFAPAKTTTRAMIVQVFYNIAGNGAEAKSAGFVDVPDGAWYATPVNWAYGEGITSGTSAATFSPNNPVTREQVATFLYNFSNALGHDTSARADLSTFCDSGTVSTWALDSMQWCVAEGLINGTDAVTLSPRASATRAQIATILMRFTEKEA